MMSVKEYATDVNVSVNEIIKLCNKLGISASDENDMLDDDSIIMLDNEVANLDVQVSDEENSDNTEIEETVVIDDENDYITSEFDEIW